LFFRYGHTPMLLREPPERGAVAPIVGKPSGLEFVGSPRGSIRSQIDTVKSDLPLESYAFSPDADSRTLLAPSAFSGTNPMEPPKTMQDE
jgi:hypothetical protein